MGKCTAKVQRVQEVRWLLLHSISHVTIIEQNGSNGGGIYTHLLSIWSIHFSGNHMVGII